MVQELGRSKAWRMEAQLGSRLELWLAECLVCSSVIHWALRLAFLGVKRVCVKGSRFSAWK